MEKKNTMLLTVIAVATLLVAVVGATFAYFSLSAGGSSSTTATVNTPKVGEAVISAKAEALQLSLTAQDMDKNHLGTYYASIDGQSKNNSEPIPIAEVTLSKAENAAKYTCTTTVTVTADNGENIDNVPNMLNSLEKGWAKLKLGGSVNEEIDIADLKDTNTQTKTGTYTLDVSTSGSVTQDILTAVLSFTNTADTEDLSGDGNQNAVAGKTLKVKVQVKEGTCTLAADGE